MGSALHLGLLLYFLFNGADLHEDGNMLLEKDFGVPTDAAGANRIEGTIFDVPHNTMCDAVPLQYVIQTKDTEAALGKDADPVALYKELVEGWGETWVDWRSCPAENPSEGGGYTTYTGSDPSLFAGTNMSTQYSAVYSKESRILHWGCRCATQGRYAHYTILFNIFVYCQIWNEFNARSIGDDGLAAFRGLHKNAMFAGVIVFTVALQLFMTQVSGDFTRTTALNTHDWFWSVVLAFLVIPMGIIKRFIPVSEDPNDFADTGVQSADAKKSN